MKVENEIWMELMTCLYIYIWGLDDNPLDPPQTNETHTFKGGGVGGERVGESQCKYLPI